MRKRPLFLFAFFIFFAFSTHAEERGVCFSKESNQVTAAGFPQSPTLTSIPLNVRHWLALRASKLVYQLSDLEKAKSGQELVEMFQVFRRQVLPGYDYWTYLSDRQSGLKYAVLAPQDPNEPWIFAFAGTETALDWMADLNLGRVQLRRVEEMVHHFTSCQTVDRFGVPLAARNWIITGHSLGGGLAQAFAFKAQSLRMLHRLQPHHMELVTFNAFGAMDLALPNSQAVKLVLPQMLATNYFVTGDPVSKIGRHIGKTLELEMEPVGANLIEAIHRHALSTVESWVMKSGAPDFSLAKKSSPSDSKILMSLKELTPYLGFLTEETSSQLAGRYSHIRVLEQAAEILFQRKLQQEFDREALRYVLSLTTSFEKELKAEPQHPLRDEQIEDLEKLSLRILIFLAGR